MYPEILKNYSAEDIALGKAGAGYKNVTAAILENARAQAAKNRITDPETQIQDREFNIRKIDAVTDNEKAAVKVPIRRRQVGGEGKALLQISTKLITVEEQRMVIQNRKNEATQKELDLIKKLRAQQEFFTKLAGGATNVQESVIPPPPPPKTAKAKTYT